MKVFICERQGNYCGGLAVVAANSIEEAFKTFFEDPDYDWMVNKYNNDYNQIEDFTKWHSDYYPLGKWFWCKTLTANVDKPCVIMESGHTE